MKLNYKMNDGTKVIVKLNGKLVGDKVEITQMEGVKLYATLLANGMTADGENNNPTALDKEAEEMVEVAFIVVKTNGGPTVGIKTLEVPADPARFAENVGDFLLPCEKREAK